MPLQLVSALGLVAKIASAWALSRDRKQFPWRVVIGGLLTCYLTATVVGGANLAGCAHRT